MVHFKSQLLDTRCFLLHCKVHSQCLCSGGFKFPHHTCGSYKLVVKSQIMLLRKHIKLSFKVSSENECDADERENKLCTHINSNINMSINSPGPNKQNEPSQLVLTLSCK